MTTVTPIIHKTNQKQIEQFISSPSHFIILSGKKGVGLFTTAQYLAKQLNSLPLIITPDEKGSIKIDTVRQLYKQTRSKNSRYKTVIIDDADTMAAPAQNVLLKLLEEPPERTVFILTSHVPQQLLQTIRSRAQLITLLPITNEQTSTLKVLDTIKDQTKFAQITFLAAGLPADIHRLCEDESYFDERSQSIRSAREFLNADSYNKLLLINALGNDRSKAIALLKNTLFITSMSLKRQPSEQLTQLLQKLLIAEEKLRSDGNIKSQLLQLVV